MAKEIRRGQWAQFIRKFNTDNQYRQINIKYKNSEKNKEIALDNRPFIGLALEKKGRFIKGIQFFAGRGDAITIAEPILTINDPERIIVEKNSQGFDFRLIIKTKDSYEIVADLGNHDYEQVKHLIEKVAYSIYVKRGGWHGADTDDWQQAEQKVHETVAAFV
ncbi:MAG: DUF2934 domain-containing protein [candidate division Zixibacteria bacterium]|nr:DUF2934 domain-containing protein [candidate division Zixibacteria bacterium]